MKNNYVYQQLSVLIATQKFKLLILLMIGNSIYGAVLSNPNLDYFSALLNVLTFPYYNLILLVIILISIFFAISFFHNSKEYIIRLETIEKKNKQMAFLCVIQTIAICVIQTILLLTMMNFFHDNNFNLSIQINGINIVMYILFFIIRSYILLTIIVYGLVSLSNYINKYLLVILVLIIFSITPLGVYDGRFIVQSISMPLVISDYFYRILDTSFLLEMIGSTIFIILFTLFILMLIDLCKCIKKHNFNKKSILYRDLIFIVVGKFKFLILYVSLIMGSLLLRRITGIVPNKLIFISLLGLNFNLDGDILSILCYMLYLIFFVYIAISLFINDIQYDKQNLFLRISYQVWLKKTLVALCIGTLLLRIVTYGIFLLFYYLLGGTVIELSSILKFFTIDLIYIIVIQICSVMAYNHYLLNKKIMVGVDCITFVLLVFIERLSGPYLWCFIGFLMCYFILQIYIQQKCTYIDLFKERGENNGN